MYNAIKKKRKLSYLDKFSDDSIKIMDIHGNILNTKLIFDRPQDITKIIRDYAINTEYLSSELKAYRKEENFYSAYFLASKYLDFGMFSTKKLKPYIIDLAQVYLEEAKGFAEQNIDKFDLLQRCSLLEVEAQLIRKNPRIALRRLKRLEKDIISESNRSFYNYLYYTTQIILKNKDNVKILESEISSVNLKKAQMLVNLNL